jgi:formylglycine-generating enzyme
MLPFVLSSLGKPLRALACAALLAPAAIPACDDSTQRASPDAGDAADAAALDADPALEGALDASTDALDPDAAPQVVVTCPPDMVLVLNRFCVDRYETSLVDADSEQPLSPYYPPLPAFDQYLKDRQAEGARLFVPGPEVDKQPGLADFPLLPEWQRRGRYKPKAISRKGATPNAYLMMAWARDACLRSEKRLCTLEEWTLACRGQQDRKFPYGDTYQPNTCNVFREDHPGRVLFGKMNVGMLDPRMNKVSVKGKPLLRKTGASPACKSEWGDDAIYDMVGNLDEWIDDPEGTFAGGFFSRTAKNGCEKVITSHSAVYYDYSTGARCCADGRPAEGRATP